MDHTKESDFPTKEDQFYRIIGTTSGGAFFGGALGQFSGGGAFVLGGAVAGAILGVCVAVIAALLATAEEQRIQDEVRQEYPPAKRKGD